METKNKIMIPAIAVAAIASVIGVTSLANASFTEGDIEDMDSVQQEMRQDRQEMKDVMDSGDYDAWQAKMHDRVNEMADRLAEMESNINEETFAKMQEAHSLMQSGDNEGAREIMDEVGIGGPMRGRMGPGREWHDNSENADEVGQ